MLKNPALLANGAADLFDVGELPRALDDDIGGGQVEYDVLVDRVLVLLESVLACVPIEQRIDDRLDLLHDALTHLRRVTIAELDDSLAKTVAGLLHGFRGLSEGLAVDDVIANQELAESVVLDVGVGEDHGPFTEVDAFADLLLREVEDAAPPVDVEAPDRVAERVAAEIAVQWNELR